MSGWISINFSTTWTIKGFF